MSPRAKRTLLVAIGLVLLLVVVAFGAVAYFVATTARQVGNDLDALNSDTSANFRPKVTAGRVEFEMTYGKDVVNLSVFTVLDAEGKKLWELEGRGTARPPVVVYGERPPGPGVEDYKQVFPEGGVKPTDIRGTSVRVEISVRYIIPLGAGHQTYRGEFDIPNGP
ncbi:hypothetical protein R5W24_003533 [Gemmata sp. JC717]|uniref:hypothetical protein n=1 Tax=Gemmata algarum TaxID=2975278 RepID=UPI0021BA952E|nr:hypothetical protein [Gemmata algarum]MDY3554411.1 hypothetical protein [Gemmata algarum]